MEAALISSSPHSTATFRVDADDGGAGGRGRGDKRAGGPRVHHGDGKTRRRRLRGRTAGTGEVDGRVEERGFTGEIFGGVCSEKRVA